MEKMRCGSCGQENHKVFLKNNGDIVLKCTQCENESIIFVIPQKLTISNHKGNGLICVF